MEEFWTSLQFFFQKYSLLFLYLTLEIDITLDIKKLSYRPPSRLRPRYASASRWFVNKIQSESSAKHDHYNKRFCNLFLIKVNQIEIFHDLFAVTDKKLNIVERHSLRYTYKKSKIESPARTPNNVSIIHQQLFLLAH